ncbi:unnamed protein product [Trichogramma brassicae]|uniref:ABC transporter domain-containing protein n=1 Tax=Trichogramma brassicae TaxID=86971 RepID=A0A6H5I6T8_9HYME|nr:unnamed protein product [Trichogramma brassicae]
MQQQQQQQQQQESWELERRYSVPGGLDTRCLEESSGQQHHQHQQHNGMIGTLAQQAAAQANGGAAMAQPPASEDLHAWSIYRQNLNSDFTDSALGSAEKSPLPYGNFQLRDSTVHPLAASNSYTYLKFGLPRVLPPGGGASSSTATTRQGASPEVPQAAAAGTQPARAATIPARRVGSGLHRCSRRQRRPRLAIDCRPSPRNHRDSSSHMGGYSAAPHGGSQQPHHHYQQHHHPAASSIGLSHHHNHHYNKTGRESRLRSASEANLLQSSSASTGAGGGHLMMASSSPRPSALGNRRHSIAPIDPGLHHHYAQHHHSNLHPAHHHLEAGAGDLLAVMSTSEREGTLILETIAGRRRIKRGEILLNGRIVSTDNLRTRVSYLSADSPEAGLSPNLTVHQCLCFYRHLRGSADVSSLEADGILIDLGLEPTKHCLVSALTCSETRRLSLGCRMLEGLQLMCLDRPTRGLDIFDAFIVEFLRAWAQRITLTSGGRVMYSGPRRDMLPYFALAEFPCPPFKNPSDYYLDLVTLDDLSAEAMLESSQRIEHLAELARARLPGLSEPQASGSGLPTAARSSHLCGQIYALFLRKLVYSQPWSLKRLVLKLLVAVSLGLALGACFQGVANDSNLHLRDRAGFHYACLGVMFWPLCLMGQIMCSIPSWCLVYLAYLAPAYALTGLHLGPSSPEGASLLSHEEKLDNFWRFLSVGLVFLLLQHYLCSLLCHLFATSWSFLALLGSGLLLGQSTLASGLTLHLGNLYGWLGWLSPLRWVMAMLLPPLHSPETMQRLKNCKAKQIQRQDIITQSACEIPDGELALRELGYYDQLDAASGTTTMMTLDEAWLLLALGVVLLAIVCVFGYCRHPNAKNKLESVPQ